MLPFRVHTGTSFVDVLNRPLPFKIPIQNGLTINQYPSIFENAVAEYGFHVDGWNEHSKRIDKLEAELCKLKEKHYLLSYSSEQAVVILDRW
jgi:hypothetical protein